MNKRLLKTLFLGISLICFAFNLSAKSTCTTPPTVLVGGKSINIVEYPNGAELMIHAREFDIGSYANCGGIAAVSFSTDVNDTQKNFDCSTIGLQTVEIFVTDTEGNQSKVFTYVVVQDNFDVCSNTTPPSVVCPNEFILHNGLAMALANDEMVEMYTTDFIQRLAKGCTGDLSTKFTTSDATSRVFTNSHLGFQIVDLQLEINNTLANQVQTFVLVQEGLSTTATCIPVPIVHNSLTTSLGPSGMLLINANDFNVGSFSDCGGNVTLSFSADISNTQMTVTGESVFTGVDVEIWVTDSQTGTQNKVAASMNIQDVIPPTCDELPTIQNSCNDYIDGGFGASTDIDGDGQFEDSEYAQLTGGLLVAYNTNFGTPSCSDNNTAASLLIEQQYQLTSTDCGVQIRRRYRAIDASSNISGWTIQNISYTDGTSPTVNIIDPSVCITGIDFDAFPIGFEDISPGAAPFECDEVKTWSASGTDNCSPSLTFSGQLFANGNEVLNVQGAFMSSVVEPNVTYLVRFTAEDECGNSGTTLQQYTFFDCVQPIVQVIGNRAYALSSSGTVSVSVFDFDAGSFDNCTAQSQLDFRIWNAALGSAAPTSLGEVEDLPTALTFNNTNLGTQIVNIYVIDESGNWSFAQTFAIIRDDTCPTTPYELPVTINSGESSTNRFWSAETNNFIGNLNWSGKLFENNVLVSEVDTNFLVYPIQTTETYKAEFSVTDACNNMGMDTLSQNFADCTQPPFVRLLDGVTYNLAVNGMINISAFTLNNGSFDNCSSSDKLAFKIWHNSQGPFPQNATAVNALSFFWTADCNMLGFQDITIFVIDETGNYASASTFVVIQDNNGVCFFPPPSCSEMSLDISGMLSMDSTYKAINMITATANIAANTNITFQAGETITLNAGFHAVAGSVFTAKIEACDNAVVEVPNTITEQKKEEEIMIAPLTATTSIEQSEVMLKVYPNPFQGQTTVEYLLPIQGKVNIQLLDLLGRQIQSLATNEFKEEGWHQLQLSAGDMQVGTYYLVLRMDDALVTRKILLMR